MKTVTETTAKGSRRGILGNPTRGTAVFQRLKRFLSMSFLALSLSLQGCYSLKTLGMHKEVVLMEVTAYCGCKKCCEWKRKWGCFLLPPVYATGPNKGKRKSVGVTADGQKTKKGVIAADTRRYPFGTIMHVPGYGWGEVHDRGRAIKGNHIDLFFKSHKKALKWGRRRVKVEIFRR